MSALVLRRKGINKSQRLSPPPRAWLGLLLLSVGTLLASCDSLPKPPASDPPNTARNASTSQWFGQSSNGSHSLVRQVSTGPNRFQFTETWFSGGKIIRTEGSGLYEPSSETNIYTYTKPEGVVVVKTTETKLDDTTIDTVLNSTVALFKPGDRITYYPRNKAPRDKLRQVE
ncbi:MAG: hypothetical protein VKM98_02145 [Cyanobacteriota bacterium]|nr:hypothetical protein [Cyanobacteriota bacterium]